MVRLCTFVLSYLRHSLFLDEMMMHLQLCCILYAHLLKVHRSFMAIAQRAFGAVAESRLAQSQIIADGATHLFFSTVVILASHTFSPGIASSYGFLFSYGIGFGGPLLLGQDSDSLDCDSNTFVKLLSKGRVPDSDRTMIILSLFFPK